MAHSQSRSKSTIVAQGHPTILFVVGKDATLVAIDGHTGAFSSTAMQSKSHSTAVSLHLLDAGGAPVYLLESQVNETLKPRGPAEQVELASSATGSVEDDSPQGLAHDEQSRHSPICGTSSEAVYLLLCCTDSLLLYSTHAVIEGQRTTLCKVKLDITCSWASTFSLRESKESGLLLIFSNGDLEFRSLPALGLLKQTSLTEVVHWKVEPSMDSQKTTASNVNGQLVLVNHDSELVQMSIVKRDSIREQLPFPRLYDKDLAKAADAAITYAKNVPKGKTPMQGMQNLLGGVLKELKNVLDIEQQQVVHMASELPKLFTSSPFTGIPVEPRTSPHQEASGSSLAVEDPIIDIDDIDLDFTKTESVPSVEIAKGNKFTNRLTGAIKSLKGKERSDKDESNRMKLFEGKDEPPQSKAQIVDDIRAKYGHPRKSQELSSIMDQTRNKLAERGEKLQDISDKTAELEDNAQNFASMAEELAKKMARKKWWEL